MDSKGDSVVDYKVVLYRKLACEGSKEQVEIRRFSVCAESSLSYDHLSKKLSSVFPDLPQRSLTVTWQDADGDEVTIRSDDELATALAEMGGPVRRISAFCGGNDVRDSAVDGGWGNSDGPTHPNVLCDGCGSPVAGFRYKCVQCADFDLCGRCETGGMHAGHNMMRISTPDRAWPRHFFSRLGKMHDRINRRETAAAAAQDPPSFFEGAAGPRILEGHCRRRGRFCGAAMDEHAAKHAEAVKIAQAEHAKKVAAAATQHPPQTTKGSDILTDIGHVVAAALDPFGINVQIGVEHGGKVTDVSVQRKKDNKAGEEGDVQKKDNKAGEEGDVQKKDNKAGDEGDVQKEELPKKKKASSSSSSDEEEEEEGDDEVREEWTLLNDSASKDEKVVEEAKVKESSDAALYPKLTGEKEPSAPPAETAASVVPTAQHDDPKIRVALQAMMNMGFKDDGGWLTKLLESKGGDIGKVLDILQPVAPVRK